MEDEEGINFYVRGDGLTAADSEAGISGSTGDVKMTDRKPTYKSWKKKYRKMRIRFEKIMQDGEDLYLQEQRGLKRAKDLAIENE